MVMLHGGGGAVARYNPKPGRENMQPVAEAEVLAAASAGQVLDCLDADSRRTLDAAILRRCCLELREQIDPRGMRLRNAVITGHVDLAGLELPFPLRFEACDFDAALRVEGAQLFELAVTGCPRLPGLLANGVRIRRDLDLSRSTVTGALRTTASTSKSSAIWLCESDIGGRLLCVDTAIDGDGERALQADQMHVGGNIRLLHQFRARGEVRLIGVRVAGSVDLTAARIESPLTGLALDLSDSIIDGSLFLIDDGRGRGPELRGRIDMGGTRIGGQFLVRDARIGAVSTVPVGNAYSRTSQSGTAISGPRLCVGAETTLGGTCQVTGGIDLAISELSSLSIGPGCSLRAPGRTALNLTNAEIAASLAIGRGAKIEGTTRLTGAHVRGRLTMKGVRFTAAQGKTLLAGQGLTVDGAAELQDVRASGGRLHLGSANLGSLVAAGARISNPGGLTLSLHHATIRGSLILADGFSSDGMVSLNQATVGGRLECGEGTFTCPGPSDRNPGGHALEAVSAEVRGGMHLGSFTVRPSLDFTNATTPFLADMPERWPPSFVISGFSYDRLEQAPAAARGSTSNRGASNHGAWNHRARVAWLARQASYDAGPYEQAARVFRQHGHPEGATAILIAQHRRAGQDVSGRWSRPRRALNTFHRLTIGYGYQPARVLWLLAALLVLVTGSLLVPAAQASLRAATQSGAVYTTQGPLLEGNPVIASQPAAAAGGSGTDACGDGQVRCFNAELYAIDTVVPLVSLDQRSTWYPDAHAPDGTFMQWWLNAATVLGWLLSSIFVLALAGLARSA